MGADPRDLRLRGGKISVIGKEQQSISLTEAIKVAFSTQVPLAAIGSWYPPLNRLDPVNGQDTRMHAYTYGAQAVEISVDIGTGVYTRSTAL